MGKEIEATTYHGTNKMLLGIVLGVLNFWLFAQTLMNMVPQVQFGLGISPQLMSTAISVTALFSGLFIVAAGNLADMIGRKKITYIGFVLSIIGSLFLVFAMNGAMLIAGRIIQGLSAACVMPATIALIKAYFDGSNRQRALSYWSIGSWGGTGFASFFAGSVLSVATWRMVFIISIFVALLGMYLLKDVPESVGENKSSDGKFHFDYLGLFFLIIAILALNIFINFGGKLGWFSMHSLGILAVFIVALLIFVKVEIGKEIVLVDFALFKNMAYTGATVSNFLLNATAGTLIVINTYIQLGRGFSTMETGMLTLGYLIAVLAMIRVGEKILQRVGAKKPMLWGAIITTIGMAIMLMTHLDNTTYLAVVFVGFALFGLGLGIYATPSTDTSVQNALPGRIGVAAGIYKMASSLGGGFGVALAGSVYVMTKSVSFDYGAFCGMMVNVIFGILSIISIALLVPSNAGKSKDK